MVGDILDFLSKLNGVCLIAFFLLFVIFLFVIWRAFSKKVIVLGVMYEDKAEAYIFYRNAYFELLNKQETSSKIAKVAMRELEKS